MKVLRDVFRKIVQKKQVLNRKYLKEISTFDLQILNHSEHLV
jgi:hypothetical protein